MSIEFRPATSGDANDIQRLLQELGYDVASTKIGPRLMAIRERNGEVFVATKNQQVVACVHVMIELRMAEGESGEIASLVVDSRYQGMNIGGKLLQQCRAWLIRQGINRLKVRMNNKRQRSHQFYIKQGMTESKTQTVFVVDWC